MRYLLLPLTIFLFSCNSTGEKKKINPSEPEIVSAQIVGSDSISTLKYLHPNGKTKAIVEQNSKGYKHGWEKVYYDNGILKHEMYFIGEKLWAVGKGNTKDGQPLDLGNLNFGSGYFIVYDSAGVPTTKGFMKNNFQDSIWTFFSSGKTRKEVSWKHGVQDGVTKSFFPNGQIESVETWNNGEIKNVTSYYESGNLYKEMNFENNMLTGISKEYYDDKNKLRQTREYKDGKENGYVVYYNIKGYIAEKGKMKNGEPVDTLFIYNEKGKIVDMKIKKKNDKRPATNI